jgi:hypothetical protein
MYFRPRPPAEAGDIVTVGLHYVDLLTDLPNSDNKYVCNLPPGALLLLIEIVLPTNTSGNWCCLVLDACGNLGYMYWDETSGRVISRKAS